MYATATPHARLGQKPTTERAHRARWSKKGGKKERKRKPHLSSVALELPDEKPRRLPIPALEQLDVGTRVSVFRFPFTFTCAARREFSRRGVTGEQTNRNHFGGRGRTKSASHETALLANVRGGTCKHVSTAGVDLALAQAAVVQENETSTYIRGENRNSGQESYRDQPASRAGVRLRLQPERPKPTFLRCSSPRRLAKTPAFRPLM